MEEEFRKTGCNTKIAKGAGACALLQELPPVASVWHLVEGELNDTHEKRTFNSVANNIESLVKTEDIAFLASTLSFLNKSVKHTRFGNSFVPTTLFNEGGQHPI
eukprot:GHVN01088758.1.p1 GENE.GHVN01088758.1~~GHVN01088758.1.p1  ORF type:complete len:104 (-),score=2.93 GHVN01088758.1:142-453(-)